MGQNKYLRAEEGGTPPAAAASEENNKVIMRSSIIQQHRQKQQHHHHHNDPPAKVKGRVLTVGNNHGEEEDAVNKAATKAKANTCLFCDKFSNRSSNNKSNNKAKSSRSTLSSHTLCTIVIAVSVLLVLIQSGSFLLHKKNNQNGGILSMKDVISSSAGTEEVLSSREQDEQEAPLRAVASAEIKAKEPPLMRAAARMAAPKVVGAAESTQSQTKLQQERLEHQKQLGLELNQDPQIRLEDKNRSILLVHIGKSGGLSLRSSTAVACTKSKAYRKAREKKMEFNLADNTATTTNTNINMNSTLVRLAMQRRADALARRGNRTQMEDQKVQNCTERFGPQDVLARQTQTFIHMNTTDPETIANATSFLITLRNPVDRIISAYRYSHPGNCPNGKLQVQPEPWACRIVRTRSMSMNSLSDTVIQQRQRTSPPINNPLVAFDQNTNPLMALRNHQQQQQKPQQRPMPRPRNTTRPIRIQQNYTDSFVHKIWDLCFTSPAMEYFAQSIMSPYPTDETIIASNSNMTTTSSNNDVTIWHCRQWARDMIQGKENEKAAPHMSFNFHHYIEKTMDLYPDKEVFGIRTTHEWTDTANLDKALGGHGNFTKHRTVSHGSEKYLPSPLSGEAIEKLCCVLVDEILIYRRILIRVVNLHAAAKQETLNELQDKCGITTSFDEWTRECKQRIEEDSRLLDQYIQSSS